MVMSFHLQKYLRKKRQITAVDRMMAVAAIIHPLTALPQVYKIYSTHNVTGISLWTWLGFMVLGTIFLLYGIVHKIKPFIMTQLLWFVIDFMIVIGVIIYN